MCLLGHGGLQSFNGRAGGTNQTKAVVFKVESKGSSCARQLSALKAVSVLRVVACAGLTLRMNTIE